MADGLIRVAGGWVTATDFEAIQARAASVGQAEHPGDTERLMRYWAIDG